MPVGYGAQCRACNSKRRQGIDERLLKGESLRDVSAWLLEQGEPIGRSALHAHKAEHLDVFTEARVRLSATEARAVNKKRPLKLAGAKGKKAKRAAQGVADSGPAFEAAVEKVIADAELLNWVASIARHVAEQLRPSMAAPTAGQATVWAACLTSMRGAVMDRHELLHGKRVALEGSGGTSLADLLAEARRACEINIHYAPGVGPAEEPNPEFNHIMPVPVARPS